MVVLKSLLLVCLFLFISSVDSRFSKLSLNQSSSDKYAVIFDAGSTGSRVHVFRFDRGLKGLLPVGNQFELFVTTDPGLSSYANDPKAAAESLKPLLEKAEAAVPQELRSQTPVRLGATAGLRQLSSDAADKILEAVRDLLKSESSLNYKAEWVSILEGYEEGAYEWVTINYLLGNLGKKYSSTVAVVDLGGGSVQIAYAVSKKSAALAPKGNETYVLEKDLMGTRYHLYAHSFLNYGLKAARAQSLQLSGDHGNPCVTNGYQGTYKYNGVVYNVSAPSSGTSMKKCKSLTRKELKLDAACSYRNCSFNGVWNGEGGDGENSLYVASFFYDTAAGAGIIKQNVPIAKVRAIDYKKAAKRACSADVDNIKSMFPNIDKRDVPFLCMDLIYEYTLLVDGFGIDLLKEITVLQQLEYKGSLVEAAWPLGCAVELLSSIQERRLDQD